MQDEAAVGMDRAALVDRAGEYRRIVADQVHLREHFPEREFQWPVDDDAHRALLVVRDMVTVREKFGRPGSAWR